ncbi:MAG: hypothetical protein Q4D38_01845 [Planctomycetia bacterium]|nr:hypothetical protein [Planctomycetia bacterium]
MTHKKYYAAAKAKVEIGGEHVEISAVKPKPGGMGARGLPLESNRPFEVYAELDKDGNIKKFRFYGGDYKASMDLDLRHSPNEKTNAHYHLYDDTKNLGKKRKTGRSNDHFEVQNLPDKYQHMTQFLGKNFSEMPNYQERENHGRK